MSTNSYDWWPGVTRMIRNYPARKQEYEDLHSQTVVADLSGMPRGGGGGRTTETIALRQMAPAKQMEYDAVTKAIEITKLMPNGDLRVELIRRMYWKGKKQSISSVTYGLNISFETGKAWHKAFVTLVGTCYGYIL